MDLELKIRDVEKQAVDREGLQVSQRHQREVIIGKPLYSSVACLLKKGNPMNMLKIAHAMTKGELDFFTGLIEQDAKYIDLTKWQFAFSTTGMTNSQKTMTYRAIRGLRSKGLIKRVSKATYMINPEFITPPDSVVIAANDMWKSLP